MSRHGKTGGPYLERQGGCETDDFNAAGLATAASIQAAVLYLVTQPFVRKNEVVVVGQSAGGWGGLALASLNLLNVKAVIAFAPGRGGRVRNEANNNCAPDHLVDAVGRFGRTARIPLLWINAENDTYFGAELAKRMADRFRSEGGRVEFHLFPAFGTEGHNLFDFGSGNWAPVVETFLANAR